MIRAAVASILLAALLCTPSLAQTSRSGIYFIQISAAPSQLPADGRSNSRLRIDLRDQRGKPVPDGTALVVHTDLGLLSLTTVGQQDTLNARTTGGFAIISLTSTQPGTATITVQAADSRSVFYVYFLPEGEAASGEARAMDISGGWVGYSMEQKLIEARDRATVRFGHLTIESGGVLQVSTEGQWLKAQDVVVRRGDAEIRGEDLYFDLAARRGVIRRFGEERLERVTFDAITLKPNDVEWDLPDNAFKVSKELTDTWLIASGISFFLREKIVLRNSVLWIQEQKVFRFPPYWIIGLPGYTGATNSQALGLSSDGGLAVDFPFFYRVTDRATGAIKIQRGAQTSSVASRDGWSVAVSEEYRNGRGNEGKFEVGGLLKDDWGFQWVDSRPMPDNGYAFMNFSMPDHRSVFGEANMYTYRNGGRLGVRAYYDEPHTYDASYGLATDWLSDPRPIGRHNLSYRLGTSLAWRRYPEETSGVFGNELYSELSLGYRSMGKKTSLQPTLMNVYSWDTSHYRENTTRAQLRLEHRASPNTNWGFDYSAEYSSGNANSDGLEQVVGADFRAHRGSKWSTYATTTYTIESGDLYSFANFDYWLDKRWRTGVSGTYYDFTDNSYEDLEFSVGRRFGEREVSLLYSTESGNIAISLGGFGWR